MERSLGAPAVPNQPNFPMLKLEIPLFDNQNPRWWVRRCERMFSVYNVPKQQKVTLATTYLNNVGYAQFQRWSRGKEGCQWEEFVEDLCEHFGDWNMMDVVEEFNKLRQEGIVQSYQLKFEELMSLILILNPHLTEGYFVSSFISSLSEELRPTVKILQPQFVKLAIESDYKK